MYMLEDPRPLPTSGTATISELAMEDSNKRKDRPAGNEGGGGGKRSKGGSGGKWQTPHQKAKAEAPRGGGRIEPGDVGMWVTCMKNKEGKATEELKVILEEYAEKFYGITPSSEASKRNDSDDVEGEEDIEASIRRELASLSSTSTPGQPKPVKLFQPVYLDVPCVLFFKTTPPIVPVDFVHKICEDALQNPQRRKCRFVNRLSPMTAMAKATEKGLEEVARQVLKEHFKLNGEEGGEAFSKMPYTYAIRPTIRNHSTLLKRDSVIKLVAGLVDDMHKVDLTKPDKTIVIEIYQTICGVAVVDSSWDAPLKRYNLFEIYQSASTNLEQKTESEVTEVVEANA